jgi:diadenosine tetraphosphatase ApaH/serine/threonine PP2A family protein phosphatase
MRYAILSDIHANLEALTAVLEHLALLGVDGFLCLGDTVGYGADPNACCDRVRALAPLCVAGNHDLAALRRFDTTWFNDEARSAAEWTAGQLSGPNREFLEHLPERVMDNGFELAHGSPAEPVTGYILDSGDARLGFEAQREAVCFVGHSHVPTVFACRRDSILAAAVPFWAGAPLELMPDVRYLVNCGAVGQPRDGDPRAACGVYDSDAGTVELVRVNYDVASAQTKILRAGLPPLLAHRLMGGW